MIKPQVLLLLALSILLIQGCGKSPKPTEDFNLELPGKVELAMVWIPPGEFVMGSPSVERNSFDDERPQTQVSLTQGYWLGRTPVTQGQWQALMGIPLSEMRDRAVKYWSSLARDGGLVIDGNVVASAADCARMAEHIERAEISAYGAGTDFPLYYVSWEDAMEFCRKLTERERSAGRLPTGYEYTLPSEVQWEYSARAGTTTRWHFGDDESRLGDFAWFSDNSGRRTLSVGQKGANPWGLHDVHGNVFEWTRSWYGAYPGGIVTDYEGASTGSRRVARGGSWLNPADDSRSAYRDWNTPDFRFHFLGFRLALSSVQ